MLSDIGGWGGGGGVSECSGRRSLIFFYLRQLGLRHDQASCWTKQYIIDKKSSFRVWRQTVKSSFNDTIAWMHGQFECEWSFYFCFDFIGLHAWCRCCSIVFKLCKQNRLIAKWVLKKILKIIINKKHFGQTHTTSHRVFPTGGDGGILLLLQPPAEKLFIPAPQQGNSPP